MSLGHARFLLVVGGLVALVLVSPREPLPGSTLAGLDRATAAAAERLVAWSGLPVRRAGATLSHPGGFACEVYWRCTGLVPAAFLALAVLAYPASRGARLAGAGAGAAVVAAVNLLRLVGLYHIGVRFPAAFPLAHAVAGEALVVLVVIGYWLAWLRWATGGGR